MLGADEKEGWRNSPYAYTIPAASYSLFRTGLGSKEA